MLKNTLTKICDWLFNVAYAYGYFPEYHDDLLDEENNYHLEVNARAMEAAIELRELVASN